MSSLPNTSALSEYAGQQSDDQGKVRLSVGYRSVWSAVGSLRRDTAFREIKDVRCPIRAPRQFVRRPPARESGVSPGLPTALQMDDDKSRNRFPIQPVTASSCWGWRRFRLTTAVIILAGGRASSLRSSWSPPTAWSRHDNRHVAPRGSVRCATMVKGGSRPRLADLTRIFTSPPGNRIAENGAPIAMPTRHRQR